MAALFRTFKQNKPPGSVLTAADEDNLLAGVRRKGFADLAGPVVAVGVSVVVVTVS